MKHLNLFGAIYFFIIFLLDNAYDPDGWTWCWFIAGLVMLAEWLRYTITREIKEYIDKKINP